VYYDDWNEGSGSHKKSLEADPETFTVLKHEKYAKDKNHVFYEGKIVKGADAATFESLDDWYARDKDRGYYGGDAVRSSNGKTFKPIDAYYSTDGIDIFYDTLPLHVCNVKDFNFINKDQDGWHRWSTDGCFYYYINFKVPSDDYAHVKIYQNSGGLSKDSKYVYFLDHKLNYDMHGLRVVDTIDAASFEVTGFLECRDKYGCFDPFHGRKDCKKRKNKE